MAFSSPIVVREVWQNNLHQELALIHECLHQFSYISIDTEFPGTVFNPTNIPKHMFSSLSPSQLYSMMKKNVDALKLIQLGLTITDVHGNLPRFSTPYRYVWQFNFRDFDKEKDLQNQDSISLLERQGIDFSKNKLDGIDSSDFAMLFDTYLRGNATWITFSGLYDYGFLIKILTGSQLPDTHWDFTRLVRRYFGDSLCDVKHVARTVGLFGGLEKIATTLKLERAAGKSHQAGSDSLLTMQVFMSLRRPLKFPCLPSIPTHLVAYKIMQHQVSF